LLTFSDHCVLWLASSTPRSRSAGSCGPIRPMGPARPGGS
jgi:hypothetical protein